MWVVSEAARTVEAAVDQLTTLAMLGSRIREGAARGGAMPAAACRELAGAMEAAAEQIGAGFVLLLELAADAELLEVAQRALVEMSTGLAQLEKGGQ